MLYLLKWPDINLILTSAIGLLPLTIHFQEMKECGLQIKAGNTKKADDDGSD